jgi:hypothetical protein
LSLVSLCLLIVMKQSSLLGQFISYEENGAL